MQADRFPLRVGNAESFLLAQQFLNQSGYSEKFLLNHFAIEALHDLLFPGPRAGDIRQRYIGDGTPLFLARTFFGGYPASRGEINRYLSREVFDAFCELGLLAPAPESADCFECPVLLYPAYGLFIAADRAVFKDRPGYQGKDYVMSGAENLCRWFLSGIDFSPCERFLDMGAGSGVAALLGAKTAGHAWAVDITERACGYAEFNRRLNGAHNLTVLCGDLFEPVRGLVFDRIACNPPFEPPLKEGMIFSVGGEDGEAIIARLLAEGPEFLAPGGRMYLQVLGTDRETETFDARIRRWLGPYQQECDTALFVRATMTPREYAIEEVLSADQPASQLERWAEFYQRLRVRQVLLGHLIVQRRASARPVFHIRRLFGPQTGLAEMQWLFSWETRRMEPDFFEMLRQSRPRRRPGWELVARQRMEAAGLAPCSYTLHASHPFQMNMNCPEWMVQLATHIDGETPAVAIFDMLRRQQEISEELFFKALHALVSAGIAEIAGFEPPPPVC